MLEERSFKVHSACLCDSGRTWIVVVVGDHRWTGSLRRVKWICKELQSNAKRCGQGSIGVMGE
jgi:hypothetical protein